MAHKFNGPFEKLDNKRRREVLPIEKITEQMNIDADEIIADIGCGIGYFTVPLAKKAKKVFGIDISTKMLDELKRRADEAGLENIIPVLSEENDFKMGENKVDTVFLCTVTHEVDDLKVFLDNIFNLINKGGRIVIVDWTKKERDFGPPASHCISEEEIIKALKISGYSEINIKESNEYYYMIIGDVK